MRKPVKRNPIARALTSKIFAKKIVHSKKVYKRTKARPGVECTG